ncbi:MAG: GNAT family N-acetyltransferase [Acidimicrobiales bacterium]
MPHDWSIEPLSPNDAEALTDLAASRGWGRTPSRWALTFALADVWGARGPDGSTLLGTVSRYRPDGGAAVVGAMLVAEGHERQGLGSALLTTALAAVPPETDVLLYATSFGESLYRRFGFIDREVMHVHVGPGPPGTASAGSRRRGMRVGAPEPASLAALVARDTANAMGDRSALISAIAAQPGALVSVSNAGTAAGLAWPTQERSYLIGPVAAADEAGALGVVATLVEAARATGAEEYRIDLATVQVGLRAWCGARGIAEVRTASGLIRPAAATAVPPPVEARRTLITQGFG